MLRTIRDTLKKALEALKPIVATDEGSFLKAMWDTLKEALKALMPIVAAIVVLQFAVLHVSADVFLRFLAGSVMVLAGITLFLYGVREGILPMGRDVGAALPERSSTIFALGVAAVFGFAVTYAEPSVMVLRDMSMEAGGSRMSPLVFVVATGMALLFVAALARILLGFPTRYLLAVVYGIILVLAMFTPPEFLSIAFDSGGAAAGPLTVPVLLALGLGFVSVLAHRSPLSDGFGLIGIACSGPIMGVLLWGIIF